MNGLGEMLRSELEGAGFVLDLEGTEPLPRSAGCLMVEDTWEGTGLEANASDRLAFCSQTYAIRVARRRPNASARITRSVVTGLGTDLVEASYDALQQATGVDGLLSDSTWELTETGARIRVWRGTGEHVIANLVAI